MYKVKISQKVKMYKLKKGIHEHPKQKSVTAPKFSKPEKIGSVLILMRKVSGNYNVAKF